VILSITAQGSRSNEPADFADVGEAIAVAAVVQGAGTPQEQLQLTWTATAGTFTGSGANVIWQAPAKGSVSTPLNVTITLTVVDDHPCGQAAASRNTVSAAHTISLHDSATEVGGMATQFLLDFSDSNITDVSYIMRNFDPVCSGTVSETGQVATNRQTFHIDRWTVGPASVTIPFGSASCGIPDPTRSQHGDACVHNAVHWESTFISGLYRGDHQIADGIDWIAAYYRPALQSWKLCDSQLTGTCTDVTNGKVCTDESFRAMVAGRIK
jgi:hypothetical protein